MPENKIKFEIELPFEVTQADRRWFKRISPVMALAILELWHAGGRGREHELVSLFAAAPDLTVQDVRRAAGDAERIREARAQGTAPLVSTPGLRRIGQLISRGELLVEADFCKRLGWPASRLAAAVAASRVFFVEYRGSRYFPTFYTDDAYDRRNLYSVTKKLSGLDAASKLQFFLSPGESLSKQTPLQALLDGRRAAVMAAAETYARG